MAIDTTGEFWRREDFDHLAEYLQEFRPGGYPVNRITQPACKPCGGTTFAVDADDTEGCARTRCLNCGNKAFIADSADYADEADLAACACQCGAEAFTVGVGFALRDDGDVRWISIGLHCVQDGTVGVYADWKIDYSPTDHLLTSSSKSFH